MEYKSKKRPAIDPASYQIFKGEWGWHVLTPHGNEQWFEVAHSAYEFAVWHRKISRMNGMAIQIVKFKI